MYVSNLFPRIGVLVKIQKTVSLFVCHSMEVTLYHVFKHMSVVCAPLGIKIMLLHVLLKIIPCLLMAF